MDPLHDFLFSQLLAWRRSVNEPSERPTLERGQLTRLSDLQNRFGPKNRGCTEWGSNLCTDRCFNLTTIEAYPFVLDVISYQIPFFKESQTGETFCRVGG